jgi:hypothetical protein
MNEKIEITRGYRVMVDDNFHYMDESYRECAGTFQNYEDALAVAKNITLESVVENESDTAEETFKNYKGFGSDPFIQPFGGAARPEENYSAWTTAEMLAQLIEVERG